MNKFVGQWIGSFCGTNEGVAVLNLEIRGSSISGTMYVFDKERTLPALFVQLEADQNADELIFEARTSAFDPSRGTPVPHSQFQYARLPTTLSLKIRREDTFLKGSWSTDIDTSGTFSLDPSRVVEPSKFEPDFPALSWEAFQQLVLSLDLEPERYVFRGQSQPWRLQTSFHRTGRNDLLHYWNEDIPRVRRALTTSIPQTLDSSRPDHNGALLHLLQHHGYPTPMLDWSFSPYVAAFFAFDTASNRSAEGDSVRVFMFDKKRWNQDFEKANHVTFTKLHLTMFEPSPIGNARALPQQSLASITNIADIESYILSKEVERNTKYLSVFDVQASERQKVLRQLAMMGISPGALFPGIEGICREYRHRHFGYIN